MTNVPDTSTKADASKAPVPPGEVYRGLVTSTFYFQPPWGDAIPLNEDSGEKRQRKVDELREWYSQFPTEQDYINYCSKNQFKPSPVLFGTGAKRDARALRYDLIPPCALKRVAKIYTEGAEHYGAHNWQKGMDYSDTIDHAFAHLLNWLDGDRTEDHLAKVAWAMFAIMYFEEHKVGNNDLEKPTNNP